MDIVPKVRSSEVAFKGRVFSVRTDTVEDEGTLRRLDIVEHAGSIAIAALPTAERILLVRQYRHAAGGYLWELPAGVAEPDEPFEQGARRELREETGYTADRLEPLCSLYPTPGFCNEMVYLYAAYGLHAGEQCLEEDERIEVREYTLQQAWGMQASGEIRDMKTVLGLLWLLRDQVK